jgi:hypothetical protein
VKNFNPGFRLAGNKQKESVERDRNAMGVRLLLEEVARLLLITFSLSDANCQEFCGVGYAGGEIAS